MVKVEKISQNGLSRTDLYVEGDFGAIDKEIDHSHERLISI